MHLHSFDYSSCTNIIIHTSFSFISGVSGTSLFNSVSLMAYNVFYTSVPVLVSVLDKDLSERTVMQHPQILFYCQAGRFEIRAHWIFCILVLYLLFIYFKNRIWIIALVWWNLVLLDYCYILNPKLLIDGHWPK